MLCGFCDHGVERLWIAAGGNVLKMWRVVANILHKQSTTPYKVWSISLRFRWWGEGAITTAHLKNQLVTKY